MMGFIKEKYGRGDSSVVGLQPTGLRVRISLLAGNVSWGIRLIVASSGGDGVGRPKNDNTRTPMETS